MRDVLPISQPRFKFVGVANIENSLSRDLVAHRDGRSKGVELEVGDGVGVRGKDHLAALINGEAGEIGVEVLAAGETVDLDRDLGIGAGREDLFPPCLEPRTMMEVAAARVGQDVHARSLNGAYEPLGLIAVGVEMAVYRGHHAVHLEALALGHIEGAICEDLDLEPLKQSMVLRVMAVPALDPAALESNPFAVETGSDLQTA